MTFNKTIIIILTLLALTLISCFDNQKSKANEVSIYPSVGRIDTFFHFYNINGIQNFTNLQPLRNGSDSLEIRIYMINSTSSLIELFTIKATKDSLIKKHYTLLPETDFLYKDTTEYSIGNFNIMHEFKFKKSDTSFINLFQKSKIDTLPTQGLIPNFKSKQLLDGGTYMVEIATKKHYRCLMYNDSWVYKDSKQNVCFSSFLTNFYGLLDDGEFDWYKNNKLLKSMIISKAN